MSNLNFNKLIEMFKNLKSDAVPRAPRPVEQVNNETPEERTRSRHSEQSRQEEEEEEIVIEPEEDLKRNKKKENKKYSKSMKFGEDDEDVNNIGDEKGASSCANIQATGTVYNIMNSKHVRLGNDFYFGPVTQATPSTTSSPTKENKHEEEHIEKDNFISLLMEATTKPEHDYLDYISKNLGKNWHSFYRSLNFTQGRIETAEINAAGYDISEARYKLLLDWVNNDEDGSLGRLATLLWQEGERSIVKALSLIYKKSKK